MEVVRIEKQRNDQRVTIGGIIGQISKLYITKSTWPFIQVKCVNDAEVQ